MWIFLGGLVAAIIVFIAWRWTSVARGDRQVEERLFALLDPIDRRLKAGEKVAPDEILAIARKPETRFMLYAWLKDVDHRELIPTDFDSPIEQAKSALVYWLMHPNELQDAPEKIEHEQEVTIELDGGDAVFHVFRYQMPEGHWAAKGGWLLGLAGPMKHNVEPYSFMPSAFSRCDDAENSITPEELVQWYADMLKKRE